MRHPKIHENRVIVPDGGFGKHLRGNLSILRMLDVGSVVLQYHRSNFRIDLHILCQQDPHAIEPDLRLILFFLILCPILTALILASVLFQLMVQRRFEQRLCNEPCDPCVPCLLLDFTPIVGGNQTDGNVTTQRLAYLSRRLDAIHACHLVVNQYGKEILPRFMRLHDLLDCRLPVRAVLRPRSKFLQAELRRAAEVFVVVHHKDLPRRQLHLLLGFRHPLEVNGNRECGSLSGSALHLDRTAHSVHDMLRNRKAKPRPLRLMDAAVILPLKRGKELFLEFLRHANAGILHRKMRAHKVPPLR